ncbi:MAG: peptidylprolyl isomerase [Planctomycetes bacterium]|nr:peptidylprolyl isomerase [Planctomycetota bacterium]
MHCFRHASIFVLTLALVGCGGPQQQNEPPLRTSGGGDAGGSPEVGEPFKVKLATNEGDIVIEVHPEWAPHGAARFRELVEEGFYDGCRFFRVIDGFMAQAGINGDPLVMAQWRDNNIPDDPVVQSNTRGYVTFAQSSQPNSRSTQFFINFGDNSRLDRDRFAPFGKVVEGMDVAEKLYSGYGDGPPHGSGPDQGRLQQEGNAFLAKNYPELDYIEQATVIDEAGAADAGDGDNSSGAPNKPE